MFRYCDKVPTVTPLPFPSSVTISDYLCTIRKTVHFQEVMINLLLMQNALKPKEIEVCEQCGLTFEFNRYIFSEVGKYKQHLDSHKTRCKVGSQ